MAKNQVTDRGDYILAPFSKVAKAGDLVNYGDYYGISENDVLEGTQGVIMITGRYLVPKNKTEIIDQGAKVYYEAGKVYATDESGKRKAIGKAVTTAVEDETEIVIDLYPSLY